MYLIFKCSCGRHLYVQEDAKTKTCPCSKRTHVTKARILVKAADTFSAGDLVRKLQLGGHNMTGFAKAGLPPKLKDDT